MLIKEIEPIDSVGEFLFDEENPEQIIDSIVELPLRKACKIFLSKGIQTVMSSANRNNLLKPGESAIEKEDLVGLKLSGKTPTFEDAGRGYAWIMINFDTLSNENKDMLFSYESQSGTISDDLGSKLIWFVHPFTVGNLDYKLATGQISIDFVQSMLPESQIGNLRNIRFDEKLAEFEKRHIVLAYNGRYPVNTVFLRMPLTEVSTVQEVESFFTRFAQLFKDQIQVNLKQERINNDLSL